MLDRIRRIVTGHDQQGQSIVHFDGILPRRLGSNRRGVTDLWSTDGNSVDSSIAEDRLIKAGDAWIHFPVLHGRTRRSPRRFRGGG